MSVPAGAWDLVFVGDGREKQKIEAEAGRLSGIHLAGTRTGESLCQVLWFGIGARAAERYGDMGLGRERGNGVRLARHRQRWLRMRESSRRKREQRLDVRGS